MDGLRRVARALGVVAPGSYDEYEKLTTIPAVKGKPKALEMVALFITCCALLAVVLAATTYGARALGFSKEDEITIIFCGSKMSLVTGVPMAKVLFPAAMAGTMVLPLMMFHQIQLMVCAVLAQRYARRAGD